MKQSSDGEIEKCASYNLISNRDAGFTKGRSAEEQARAVDDEDTSASLKAFHMLLYTYNIDI